MTSVFISYSRLDQAFVRRVYDTLKAADRDAWVDWEGIPPTAEWLKEIYGAIESADTFVFVLSPDSLASEVCGLEVAYALENKKRIIPLVCRDVTSSEVRANERLAPVADLNWIFFRQSDDFLASFQLLLNALDTDLEYVQKATRFLVRAKQWQASRQSSSLALRGIELSQAESWLAEGADKQPSPTALQVQYITSSRKATNRTQRIVISALSVGLIITIGLSVLSYVQSQYAQAQQHQAELAAQIAQSRQLTALAKASLLQNQIGAAQLYSLKSLQIHADDNSRSSLLNSLEYSPYLETILPSTPDAPDSHRDAMSRDGQTIALVESSHVTIWHRDSGKTLSIFLTLDQREQTGGGGEGISLALSPNGKLLVLASFRGVWLWDAVSGAPLGQLPGQTVVAQQETSPVAFSADGHWLVTQHQVCLGGFVNCQLYEVVWKVQDVPARIPTKAMTFLALSSTQSIGAVSSATFSADDRWLVASGWTYADPGQDGYFGPGLVLLFDMQSGALADTYTGMGPIWSATFTARSNLISAGCADVHCSQSQLLSWNVNGGRLGTTAIIGTPDGLHTVTASADGNVLVSQGSQLLLWRFGNGLGASSYRSTALLGPQDDQALSADATLSGDGRWLLSRDGQDTVLWNTTPHRFGTISLESDLQDSWSDSLGFSANGALIAGTITNFLSDNSTGIWDAKTGRLLTNFVSANLVPLVFSPDGKTLATWDNLGGIAQSHIELFDTATGQLIGTPVSLPSNVTSIAISPDLRMVAGIDLSDSFTLYDMATGQPVRFVQTPDKMSELVFSPDGRIIATDGDKQFYLWNAQTGELIGSPLSGLDGPVSITFSQDGRFVAARDSHSIRVWDVKTHTVRATLSNTVSDGPIALSPDGSSLAYAQGNLITVWDLAKGERLAQPFQAGDPSAGVSALEYSPDGQTLASAGGGGLLLWDTSFDSWIARACHIANRNFTAAEWEQFDDIQNYTPICPNLPVHSSVIEAWLSFAKASASSGNPKRASRQYAQATQWALASHDDTILDEVCWRGSVGGFASVVISACNAATALFPQDGDYRDSRGLSRALIGDRTGAITDFEAFVAWANRYAQDLNGEDAIQAMKREATERQQWINALQTGSNPFTSKQLDTIAGEKYT